MGFSQAPGLPYSKLGIPEDGDAASRAISKGKYVIWKGKNYFAKTDILQGETFVEDTNLTEIPDGALNGIAEAFSAFFNSKIAIITDTVASGSGTVTAKSYPTGFNKSNCMVISVMIERNHGDKISEMSNGTQRIDVNLLDDYVEIITRDVTASSEWGIVGKPFTIVLLRIS